MLFSINFSTQAAVLFQQGRLKIDRFKCPDWPYLIDEASEYCPPAVHFNLTAGRGKFSLKTGRKSREWIFRKLDEVDRIANETQTPYINLHLEARNADFPEIPIDSTLPSHQEMIFSQVISDVETVVSRFGRQRIIIENVPYRPSGHVLRPSVEPELISKVIEQTGCGLLLDIPHARISAQSLGIDETEYFNRLPVHRLKELHFTGVQNLNGWLQDHLPALEADWKRLDWALERIRQGEWPRPWLLAFEYGGVGEKFTWRTSAQEIEIQGNRIYRQVNPI